MFSVFVIGDNQGLTLEACLASVAEVDDIVYLDAGSTDGSLDIAAKYKARIFSSKGLEGGSVLINHAASLCCNLWTLWLSTDHELEAGGVQKINSVISKTKATALGCDMRESRFPDFRSYPRRLFCKTAKWFGHAYEYVDAPIQEQTDIRITHTRGPWHDNPRDPLCAAKALELDIKEDPTNPRWYYYYARDIFWRKNFSLAAEWFEKRVSMPGGYTPETADAYLFLAYSYWNLSQGDKARNACMSAIRINPDFKEAILFMVRMSTEENSKRWKLFAESATNQRVLIVR